VPQVTRHPRSSLFTTALAATALTQSVLKLHTVQLVRSPVMFTMAVVALLATLLARPC